ncbi:MAG: hypothetical protein HYZ39_25155 [Mycolicibacterium cosmeticum]|nr:hypothetical protein [Mycolicibacterium cosmeticum]
MDDPQVIANAFAASAKKVVADSQAEVIRVVNQINKNPGPPIGFTVDDAIKSWIKLAKIAIEGGVSMGQTALQVEPKQSVLVLADHLATIATQSVADAKTVADEVSDLIAAKTFDSDSAVHTTIKLANIALLNGADALQTVAAGPAQYAPTIIGTTVVLQAPLATSHKVTVVKVALGGPPTVPALAADRITLDPADGVLPAGATEFTIIINSAGLTSGSYIASIDLDDPLSGASQSLTVTLPL